MISRQRGTTGRPERRGESAATQGVANSSSQIAAWNNRALIRSIRATSSRASSARRVARSGGPKRWLPTKVHARVVRPGLQALDPRIAAPRLDFRFDEAASPGSYLLLLRLNQVTELTVGRLDRFVLTAGWYVYVGSALGGLDWRLRRHLRREKVRHWHIDALREVADLVCVSYRVGPERLECAVAAALAERTGASRPVPRFGASDCHCPAHLIRFGDEPDLRLGPDWLVRSIPDELGPPIET